jgi:hypothetical protein
MRLGHRIVACSILSATSIFIGVGVASLQAGAATTHHQRSSAVTVRPKEICALDDGVTVCGGASAASLGALEDGASWAANVAKSIAANWGMSG